MCNFRKNIYEIYMKIFGQNMYKDIHVKFIQIYILIYIYKIRPNQYIRVYIEFGYLYILLLYIFILFIYLLYIYDIYI